MTREEYNEMRLELIKRGYNRNFGELEKPEDDGMSYFYKTIERRKDRCGDERSTTQLLFKIWNFEKYKDRVPYNSLYSLEPVVDISRNIDERIELILSHPRFSIDECEEIARKFGKWVDENIEEKQQE